MAAITDKSVDNSTGVKESVAKATVSLTEDVAALHSSF
jgi:hypothetical protein